MTLSPFKFVINSFIFYFIQFVYSLALIEVEILFFFSLKKKRLEREAGIAPKIYSNLILYFLMLNVIKNTVIPINIRVSFHIY